jgi:hypothetical protein
VATKAGPPFHYFADPQLVVQAHDLKNRLPGATAAAALQAFKAGVLDQLQPASLDFQSSWVDLGHRDTMGGGSGRQAQTLLWRRGCLESEEAALRTLSPLAPATFYTSHQLADAATYTAKGPIRQSPESHCGHPQTRIPGLVRIKAYQCAKEMTATMFSDYQLFGSPALPMLALSDGMIDHLYTASHGKGHVQAGPAPSRAATAAAWNTNKKHLYAAFCSPTSHARAEAGADAQTRAGARARTAGSGPASAAHLPSRQAYRSYGARKEATFRLDALLHLWLEEASEASEAQKAGRAGRPGKGTRGSVLYTEIQEGSAPRYQQGQARVEEGHVPYWVIPTEQLQQFILAQALRLILSLEAIFQYAQVATSSTESQQAGQHQEEDQGQDQDQDQGRAKTATPAALPLNQGWEIVAFHTATLLHRLLVASLTSETEYPYENWIWKASWQAKVRPTAVRDKTEAGQARRGRGRLSTQGRQEPSTRIAKRFGLGLALPRKKLGFMLLPAEVFDWSRGMLQIRTLRMLYLPRSPHQLRWIPVTTAPSNRFLPETYLRDALQKYLAGKVVGGLGASGSALQLDHIIMLTAQVIGHAYSDHFLARLEEIWARNMQGLGLGRLALPGLTALQAALAIPDPAALPLCWPLDAEEEDAALRQALDSATPYVPPCMIPAAQDIHLLFHEAWSIFRSAVQDRAEAGGSILADLYTTGWLGEQLPEVLPDHIGSGPAIPHWMCSRQLGEAGTPFLC